MSRRLKMQDPGHVYNVSFFGFASLEGISVSTDKMWNVRSLQLMISFLRKMSNIV